MPLNSYQFQNLMSATPATLPIKAEEQRTLWGDVWIQFRKHRGALFGMFILALIVFMVTLGPVLYGKEIAPDYTAINASMSWDHPLGANNLGYDTLARVMTGGRVSLAVGVVAMLIALFFGTVIGILAGYFSWLDGLLMRTTDIFLALPLLPLLLVIIMLFRDTLRAQFGPETGIFILIVTVIGVLNWMPTARVVRGEVLSLKEREFVTASISIGTRHPTILVRHIFPNVLSPIMVAAPLGIANAIITESTLSFLGLGFPSDFPTWGRILFEGLNFISLAPGLVMWPGLFISLTVLSVNFIGNGLRDALDPRARDKS